MHREASLVFLVAAATAVQAHYTFPNITYNSQQTTLWQYVRETTNHYSHGPVTDVTSSQMTCYQLASGNEGALTMNVTAGSTFTFSVDPQIQHPGPLSFYIGQVPSGQTASTWDGSGAHWSKIYQDEAVITSSAITWPSNYLKTTVDVTIPKCLANGDYLLRPEHVGLHSASQSQGAQFYLGCAQITVSGGTGTYSPKKLVSIPGAFTQSDPGILIDIWYPVPQNYTPPGPPAESC